MDDILTFAEIEARYAPDWVLIGDLQTNERLEIVAGKVFDHGSDRDAMYRRATELGLDRIAVRYLGPWPEDMALVL